MADLAALQVQLELQTAQFTEQMKQVNGQLDKLNNKVNSVSDTFKKAGAAIAGMVSVGTVIAIFQNAVNAMDDLRDSAQKLGTTTEELSALQFAAQQSGVSIEQLSTGLGILNKNLADVEKGTTDAAKVLRTIGVDAGDTTLEAFTKISEAFKSLPAEANKTAIAMAVFGKSGKELIPLLNEGAEGIDTLMKRAKELGIVLDGEAADNADAFNDALGEVQAGMRGVVTQIVQGMLPSMVTMAEAMASTTETGDDWKLFGEGVGLVLRTIGAAAVVVGGAFQRVATGFAGLFAAAAAAGTGEFRKAIFILDELATDIERMQEENAKLVTSLMTSSEAQGKANEQTKKGGDNTKLLAELMNALGTETDKTKKKTQEYTQQALTPMQQMLIDLNKAGQQRLAALEQLEFLKTLPPAALEQLGLSVKQIAEAQERMKKSAEVWTVLDQAISNITSQKQAVADMSAAWDELVDQFSRGDISPEHFAEIVAELQKMDGSVKEAATSTTDFTSSIQKLGEEVTGAIASNANNAINEFIDSIGTAEFSFSKFAESFLKDIAKMVTQLLIMKPLMASIQGMFGISGASVPGTSSAAVVIPASIPTVPTVGATSAFASAGFQSSGISPVGTSGGVGVRDGGKQVVNVYNRADVEVSTKESQGADGTQVIDMYIDRRINQRFSDGSMDKMMRTNFGIMRNAGA